MAEVPSPCTNICALKGEVCIGCGRTLDEIAEWPNAGQGRRRAIVAAAKVRKDRRPDIGS